MCYEKLAFLGQHFPQLCCSFLFVSSQCILEVGNSSTACETRGSIACNNNNVIVIRMSHSTFVIECSGCFINNRAPNCSSLERENLRERALSDRYKPHDCQEVTEYSAYETQSSHREQLAHLGRKSMVVNS